MTLDSRKRELGGQESKLCLVVLALILLSSASIGNFAPEKYVWKICIALHSAPRLFICQLHHSQMRRVLSQSYIVQQVAVLSCTANLAEIFSLLLLSVVPSMEDHALHKISFASFLLFSGLFIATSYYLLRYYLKH